MKKLTPFLLIILSVTILPGQAGRRLTLEDIFLHEIYAEETFTLEAWVEGGAACLTTRKDDGVTSIVRHDTATGAEKVFLESGAVTVGGKSVPIDDFQLSPDERWVLVSSDEQDIWRRSKEATYYLHNLATGATRRLADPPAGGQSNAAFSPDSRKVAYVMGHNIYVYDIDKGRTRQLTRDGSKDIINGQADWLYEEEFGITRMYEWSPDGTAILYLRFDQGPVRSYPLKDELTQYPEMTWVRYPKVGERNAIVKLGVVKVKGGGTKWLDLGSETDIYIPRLYRTGRAGEAAFYRLNRIQQRLELVLADTRTGKTSVAAVQTDPAWVDVTDDLYFIDGGRRFVWTSEESGYRHIYLHDLGTGAKQALTSGDWEVTSVVAVDEEGQAVYFTGKKDGVVEQHVYRVGFGGGDPERLTPQGGWNSVQFAPDFAHHILERSDLNTPTKVSLHNAAGQRVRWLVESPPSALRNANLPRWEIFSLTTTDGQMLHAKILKPVPFNPQRKYPALIYTYGGPGVQKVMDQWGESRGRDLWHRYMAQNGYVVLTVDNRGTNGRGKAFENLAYGNIGKWAINDQIEAAKWVGRQSWGDPARVAIWGWSGGGYTTSLCLTAGAEYFECGIAVAPLISPRLYDTAWTERYMGLLPENTAGYDSADVLSYVDLYRGGLLIVHGTGDDNVHPQHTWQLVEKLAEANRPFDMVMYPGKNHDLPGRHYHLYSRMTAFLKASL